MAKAKQIKITFSLIIFVCFALVSFTAGSEIFGSLNTANIQNTVNNCNPLTVEHGTVSAFPECLITCEAGYVKNNNACVAISGGGGGGGGNTATSIYSPELDLNHDNKIDVLDFNLLILNWGQTGNNAADLNHDGIVDMLDFNFLMLHWTF